MTDYKLKKYYWAGLVYICCKFSVSLCLPRIICVCWHCYIVLHYYLCVDCQTRRLWFHPLLSIHKINTIKYVSELTGLVHIPILCTCYLVWCLDVTLFRDNLVLASVWLHNNQAFKCMSAFICSLAVVVVVVLFFSGWLEGIPLKCWSQLWCRIKTEKGGGEGRRRSDKRMCRESEVWRERERFASPVW